MGKVKKVAIGALGWGLAAALLFAGVWWSWRFIGSGAGSGNSTALDTDQPALPAPSSPHAWRGRIPLITLPAEKRPHLWPDPIRLAGIVPAAIPGGKNLQIPIITLAGGRSPIIPLISIASIGRLASNAAPAISPIRLGDLSSHADPAALSALVSTANANIESMRYDDDILDPGQQQRKYAMSMCVDHRGDIWVGCINTGIWRFDPTAGRGSSGGWTQFTTRDGLGDDNGYALACDRKGRIWAGHLNHGVSVFNGQTWQNYDVIGGLNDTPSLGTPGEGRGGGLPAVPARSGEGNSPSPGTPGEGGVRAPSAPASRSGPLGERIFHIAVNPADGDVWICTSAGLARYRSSQDTWTYYTRADGLPSDQPNSIAFAPDGHIFVATQCDGVAIGTPASDGSGTVGVADPGSSGKIVWRTVTSPYPNQPGPAAPTGPGLPCNLLNDILVTKDGTVYCATDAGLAWSTDDGTTWQYVRGKDWADKIRQSAAGPPPGWTPAVPPGVTLVEQDYITCLAESPAPPGGHLILGYQQAGWPKVPWTDKPVMKTIILPPVAVEATSPSLSSNPATRPSGEDAASTIPSPPMHITEVFHATSLAVGPSHLYAGTYAKEIIVGDLPGLSPSPGNPGESGSGFQPLVSPGLPVVPARWGGGPSSPPPFPSGAPTPTLADLNAELAAMANVPPLDRAGTNGGPTVIALDEDWLTDGRWLGRYGRYGAIICAECSPEDYVWGAGPEPMRYDAQIGPHHEPGDSLRYWISALYSKDPQTLEIPPVFMDSRIAHGFTTPDKDRRPCIWDDHGEAYPGTFEGPDIYCTVRIPAGTFILTLAENDGFSDRDLDLVIREHDGGGLYGINDFDNQPNLATGRATKFDGNLYKRFLVRGPNDLTLKIGRNYSFLTTASAIFLDLPDERPVPYFMSAEQWKQSEQDRATKLAARLAEWKADPGRYRGDFAPQATELAAAKQLMAKLDKMREWNPKWWAENHRRIAVMAARWAAAGTPAGAPSAGIALKASILYQVGDYDRWEQCQAALGERTARQIDKSLKWDGVTHVSSGRGYQIVTGYLASQTRPTPTSQPGPDRPAQTNSGDSPRTTQRKGG